MRKWRRRERHKRLARGETGRGGLCCPAHEGRTAARPAARGRREKSSTARASPPCAATIATIQKESKSWGWAIFTVVFQLLVAWVVTFLVYQIGSLLVG